MSPDRWSNPSLRLWVSLRNKRARQESERLRGVETVELVRQAFNCLPWLDYEETTENGLFDKAGVDMHLLITDPRIAEALGFSEVRLQIKSSEAGIRHFIKQGENLHRGKKGNSKNWVENCRCVLNGRWNQGSMVADLIMQLFAHTGIASDPDAEDERRNILSLMGNQARIFFGRYAEAAKTHHGFIYELIENGLPLRSSDRPIGGSQTIRKQPLTERSRINRKTRVIFIGEEGRERKGPYNLPKELIIPYLLVVADYLNRLGMSERYRQLMAVSRLEPPYSRIIGFTLMQAVMRTVVSSPFND